MIKIPINQADIIILSVYGLQASKCMKQNLIKGQEEIDKSIIKSDFDSDCSVRKAEISKNTEDSKNTIKLIDIYGEFPPNNIFFKCT